MRVKARWVVTLLVGVWVVVTVLYLAPLFWAVQEEKVVRVTPVFTKMVYCGNTPNLSVHGWVWTRGK